MNINFEYEIYLKYNFKFICVKAIPILKGIGLSMNTVNALANLYYNMIIGYSIYYLVLVLLKILIIIA